MHDPATCQSCRARAEFKATFSPGPWHDEPDREDFHAHGLPCFLNRNSSGVWCGYAGVQPGHSLYGLDYYQVNTEYDVCVHGGLTYSAPCCGCLCHTPALGIPDVIWWFGFDCGQAYDVIPSCFDPDFGSENDVYRDLPFARAQTVSLAAQLAALSTIVPA